ncbi:hypothetical protein GCM10018980_57750 [Streptomyces capoamus]|uniref:Uncharacterized protein n=1 Tax=Streptomyces capoamus TaxID=68183 RepID=A0A919KEQ9_9ACTN|nr:hypothetical protein GCM10010501_47450 [Streptomyces libani subsp. rufus]GHG65903.1 hypothetical protein GCM10018980_57750 [Streptomyces capoamus]
MSNIVGNYFRLGPLTETRPSPQRSRLPGPAVGSDPWDPRGGAGRLRVRQADLGGGRHWVPDTVVTP